MHAFLIIGKNKSARNEYVNELLQSRMAEETLNFTTDTKHSIENIRSIKQILKFSSSKKRAIILKEAQLLTVEAANAFLKTLEEPAENTIFLLTAPSRELVLETVSSRCQTINLGNTLLDTPANKLPEINELLAMSISKRLEFTDKIKDRREAINFSIYQLLLARKLLKESPIRKHLRLVESFSRAISDLEQNVNLRVVLGDLMLNLPQVKN